MEFGKLLNRLKIAGLLPPLFISIVFAVLVYSQIIPESWRTGSQIGALAAVSGLALAFYWFCSIVTKSHSRPDKIPSGPLMELVEKNRLLFITLLIVLPVIIFNLAHVFGPRYLLADDPSGYLTGIDSMVRISLWTDHYILNAFTETFALVDDGSLFAIPGTDALFAGIPFRDKPCGVLDIQADFQPQP